MVKLILQIISFFAPAFGKWLENWVGKSGEREKRKQIRDRDKIRREKRELIRRIENEKDPEEQKRLIKEFADRYGSPPND